MDLTISPWRVSWELELSQELNGRLDEGSEFCFGESAVLDSLGQRAARESTRKCSLQEEDQVPMQA